MTSGVNKRNLFQNDRWVGVSIVVILAALVRLAASWVFPISLDEQGARATVEGILQGHHYIYLAHSCYLAPVSEYVSAVLFYWFGPSTFILRIPYVIWGALAAGLWWWILSPRMPSRVYGIVFGIFLAFPSMSNLAYEVPGPAYAFGRLLIACLLCLALSFPVKPKWWHYTGLALFAGLAIYIFPLCKVPVLFCLMWIALRDWEWIPACGVAWKAASLQARLSFIFFLGLGGGLFGAAAYHYLTRAQHYQMTPRMAACWCVGTVFLVVAAVKLVRAVSWHWIRLVPVVCMLAVALFVARIPDSIFRAELAKLPLDEQAKYGDFTAFVLEHEHNWPARSRFTVEYIVPQVFTGLFLADAHRVGVGYVADVPVVPWRLAIGLAWMAVFVVGLIRGLRDPSLRGPLFIVGGSALLVLLVLMVTFKSANLYNYRYLGVFSPGLFLAMASAFRFSRWGLLLLGLATALGCLDLVLKLISI